MDSTRDCIVASDDEGSHQVRSGLPKLRALPAVAGTPDQIVAACRDTIVAGAMPHDPVSVEAVTAGKVGRHGKSGLVAPLFVRIVYARQGGYEVRQASVKCRLDAQGTVASLA